MKRSPSLVDVLIGAGTFGAFLFTVATVLASLAPARAATRWPTHVHDFRDRKMLDARGVDVEAR
jgi:hypothetical protein